MNKEYKVYTIIVTYNGMKWIEECLLSIQNSSIPVLILVVDNYSTDGTREFIKTNFRDVILIESNQNLGFGKANNIGLSYALKKEADFVFLLNQDALVNENTIQNLINIANKNPEFGIVSPIQLDFSGQVIEKYFFNFMARDETRKFYSDFVLQKKQLEIYPIQFIQAAAWLLPMNTIKKIGGFDPLFYHYGEDDNYCQRVVFHKLKIGVVATAFIRHDSTQVSEQTVQLFSERYYKNYIKDLAVKYANLNLPYTSKSVSKERKKLYKLLFYSLIKLNVFKVKGFLKTLFLLNKNYVLIRNSREINMQLKPNHLDLD